MTARKQREERYAGSREAMVERQLRARGIRDERVLAAMASVPREHFVADEMKLDAYGDSAQPIGEGQTISQPYIVALMAEALSLEGDERVLDVGTGSGYAAAVVARLAREVYSIERHASLADRARGLLRELGVDNVEVRVGDGSQGWAEHAPYQGIQAAAAALEVPRPLVDQLDTRGVLVLPVERNAFSQELVRLLKREDGSLARRNLGGVRFVPLVGGEGG
jgi:protein-L-isoaspartate(D-aspartate) O-methyltransferase